MTRKATGFALALLVLAWCVIPAPQLYGSSMGFWGLVEVIVVGLWTFSVPALAYIAVWFLDDLDAERRSRTVFLALGVGGFSGAWIAIAGLLALEAYQRVTMGYVSEMQPATWFVAPVAAAPVAIFGAIIGFFIGLLVKTLRA